MHLKKVLLCSCFVVVLLCVFCFVASNNSRHTNSDGITAVAAKDIDAETKAEIEKRTLPEACALVDALDYYLNSENNDLQPESDDRLTEIMNAAEEVIASKDTAQDDVIADTANKITYLVDTYRNSYVSKDDFTNKLKTLAEDLALSIDACFTW